MSCGLSDTGHNEAVLCRLEVGQPVRHALGCSCYSTMEHVSRADSQPTYVLVITKVLIDV